MKNTVQIAVLMAVFTLASKCFGFIREMVMANYYGTSYVADAYVMALAIPSIIIGGVLSAVSVAYLPIYSKTIEEEGEAKANEFTSATINIVTIFALVFALLGIFFSEGVVSIFAHGFTGETAELTIFFLRITFFYLVFSSAADIIETFLRYKNIFLPQVAFGFLQNIILISTIVISAFTSYYYLVFGYFAVYIIRLIIMAMIAKKMDFKHKFNARTGGAGKRIFILSMPVFIGSGMAQINAFVDKTLASGLPEGSVAALNYGYLLITMISGLTVTILNTIIYPKLAQASAANDNQRLSNIVSKGVVLITIIAAPCSLGAITYNSQIVQIVYERGEFDSLATSMTGSAFLYYSIGLLFFSFSTIATQIYYSKQNMITPVLYGAIGLMVNITLNLILVQYMQHSGLALATSIAGMCNSILLFMGLRVKYPEIEIIKSKTKLVKVIMAAFTSVGMSYLAYTFIVIPLEYIIVSRTMQLAITVMVAVMIYLGLLLLLKIDEIKLLKLIMKK